MICRNMRVQTMLMKDSVQRRINSENSMELCGVFVSVYAVL